MTVVLGNALSRREATQARPTRTRRHLRLLLGLVAVADLLVLVAAVVSAWELRLNIDVWTGDGAPGMQLPGGAALAIILLWITVLTTQGAYSPRYCGTGQEEFKVVYLASVITAGSFGMFAFLLKLDLSRGFVLLSFFLGIPMLVVERYLIRKVLHRLRVRGHLLHRVVAVGGPSAVNELTEVLRRERYVGYEICGACVPAGMRVDEDDLAVPLVGEIGDTRRVVERLGADTVLVARGAYASSADLRRIAWDLEGSDVDLVVVPSLTDVAGPRIHMRPVAGLPLLHVEGPQVDEAGGLSKRAFDVVGSLVGILLLSPLFLVVAAIVRLEDHGPVFFRQPRVGRGGEPFHMFKFRSMVPDADARRHELEHLNEFDSVLFKIRDDPRITRVGKWLRRYSVDELPQLFNVLRGEMSLVGPRPPLAAEVELYDLDVRRRLLVRPGMTGLWQVSGRSSLPWKEAVRLDLYYVDNWSMVTDLAIIAKTVKAVVGRDGAY